MIRIAEGEVGPIVFMFWPRRSLARLVLPLLAIALLGAACGSGGGSSSATATKSGGEAQLTVTMSDALQFQPAQLAVNVGVPVVLTVDNVAGAVVHDFSVERISVRDMKTMGGSTDTGHMATGGHGATMAASFDMHIAVDPGKMGTLRFTPNGAGEYAFFCSVTGHREAGMEGKLVVS